MVLQGRICKKAGSYIFGTLPKKLYVLAWFLRQVSGQAFARSCVSKTSLASANSAFLFEPAGIGPFFTCLSSTQPLIAFAQNLWASAGDLFSQRSHVVTTLQKLCSRRVIHVGLDQIFGSEFHGKGDKGANPRKGCTSSNSTLARNESFLLTWAHDGCPGSLYNHKKSGAVTTALQQTPLS